MSGSKNILDYVSQKAINQIRKQFKAEYGLNFKVSDINGQWINEFNESCETQKFCSLVSNSYIGKGRCKQEKITSLNFAIETGSPYITFCHAGLILVTLPIMSGETPLGGIFFGKCLCGKINDSLKNDISRQLKGVISEKTAIFDALENLDIVDVRVIHKAAEFLFELLYEKTGLDPNTVNWRREKSYQQSQICELIAANKNAPACGADPYQYEQQLMNMVRIGDRVGVRDTLNIMLALIMLKNPGDIGVLKARMLELSTLLSRAAAEGGVTIDLLLKKNLENINALMQIDNQQDLCAWVGRAVEQFIDLVYSKQDSQKITQIKPAIDFIKAFYDQQISLADIAEAAHLSVSRLSHVFKEQMNITIIDYLTQVRIEKAKRLLISTDKNCTEICYEVGYNNQSYFTRIFKESLGITPRQFRNRNRRNLS